MVKSLLTDMTKISKYRNHQFSKLQAIYPLYWILVTQVAGMVSQLIIFRLGNSSKRKSVQGLVDLQ